MATEKLDPRAELAKMEAEETAAKVAPRGGHWLGLVRFARQ